MNHLKRRSICKSCQVCFVRDNDIQVYCHSCLMDAHYKSKNVISDSDNRKKKCLVCNCMFISYRGKETCSDHCKKELLNLNGYLRKKEKEITESNEEGLTLESKRWLAKKKRDTSKSLPFHEVNRRSEYSRVFGKYSESPLYFKRRGFGK